jgi:hypothetical protein
VLAARIDRYVENASTEVVPRKSWRWAIPGIFGWTIGSSGNDPA